MSREVDERVVAMYFDNKDFEQKASKTINTLNTLKQSANMEGIGKGFDIFEKFGKTSNFDKVTQSASKLRNVLGTFGNTMRQAFNLTPLNALYNGLENFKRNYFDRMIGFDIAGKLASGFENAIRGLTIAPVSAGWGQYENTMDSVKTIMSSTGETIETVKTELAGLTEYANKTIYSLNDMTSNIGKFTNNGVKLKDATNAMIGLSNATADAGQGAQQASMAMYNMSQAIGVGKMTTIDWKSFENANVATKKLKQVFIDSAVASGTLEKKITKTTDAVTGLEKEEVTYWTKAEKGSNAVQVSFENFRETLNKDWLTKDAMLKTMGIFSGQLSVDEIAAMGFSKEESARLHQIGIEAMQAAQEVRTFSKMMDALREGVQSTWAESFEYIFGDMNEGTNLWTRLNNEIEEVLNRGAKSRNDILMSWRGMMRDENGNVKKIEDVYKAREAALGNDLEKGYISIDEYNKRMSLLKETLGNQDLWVDYREIAVDTLMDVIGILKQLGSTASNAWTNVFGSFTSDTLKGITQGISEFVGRFKEWLGDASNADSRLGKLQRGLSGIFSVLKAVWSVVEGIFSVGWEVIQPLFDPILNIFAAVGDFLNLGQAKNLGDVFKTLGKRIGEFWDKIKNWDFNASLSRVSQWFNDIWTDIRTGVSNWFTDNGLEGVAQWFTTIGDKIKEGYSQFSDWWTNKSGIPEFFSGIWTSIAGVFQEGMDEAGNPVEAPIVLFFKNIGTSIEGAWADVQGLPIWGQLGTFFSNLWSDIVGLFEPKDMYDDRGFKLNQKADSPIVAFFKGISSSVESAYNDVVTWWNGSGIPDFFTGLWDDIMGLFEPKDMYDDRGFKLNQKADSPIVAFFKNISTSVTNAYNDVVEWWNGSGIPDFFTGLWDDIMGLFEPKVIQGKMGNTWTEDSPIVAFFKNISTSVTDAYNDVVEWWHGSGIPEFFTGLWSDIVGLFEPKVIQGKMGNTWTEDSPIVAFFKGIGSAVEGAWKTVGGLPIWDEIKKFFEGLWEKVSGVFETGMDKEGHEVEAPIVTFFNNIKTGVEEAFNNIVGWPGWEAIGNFFTDTWNWLIGLFNGSESSTGGAKVADNVAQNAALAETLSKVGETVQEVTNNAEEIPTQEGVSILDRIGGFFSQVFEAIGNVANQIAGVPEIQGVMEQVNKILAIIETVVKAVIDFLYRVTTGDYSGKPESQRLLDILTIVFGVLATLISKITEARRIKGLATIAESASSLNNIGMQILEVAAAILVIALAVERLSKIKFEDLAKGEGAVAVIGAVLALVAGMVAKVREAGADKEPEKAWERVLGKLISYAGMAGMLWILMEKLPDIIAAMSEAKKYSGFSGEDISSTLLGILGAMGGAMVALAVVNKIAPNGIDPKATFKTVLSVMEALAGLAIVAGGAYGLGWIADKLGTNPEDVKDKIAIVAAFLEGLGDAVNGLFRGLLGTTHAEAMQEKQAEQNLENSKKLFGYLSQVTDSFDMTRLTDLSLFLSSVSDMVKMTDNVDTKHLLDFSSVMEKLATGLLRINDIFTGKYTFVTGADGKSELTYLNGLVERGTKEWDNLMAGIDIYSKLFNAMIPVDKLPNSESVLSGYTRWFRNTLAEGDGVEMFINGMNKIIDSAGGLHDASNIDFDGIAIVSKFYESIQDAFNVANETPGTIPKFNAKPIVDSILDALYVGEYAIKEGVKRMVQGGIDLLNASSGSQNYDLSGILGGMDWDEMWGFMKQFEPGGGIDKATEEVTKKINEYTSGTESAMDKSVEALNKKYGSDSNQNGVGIKVSGLVLDENFMTNLEAQMTELQTILDTNDNYTLELRPVFKTEGLDSQVANLSEFINGSIPIKFDTASIDLGEKPLLIDDSSILSKMDALRIELAMTRTAIKSAVDAASISIGSRIGSIGSTMRGMRVTIDKKALVGAITDEMDGALGDAVGAINIP